MKFAKFFTRTNFFAGLLVLALLLAACGPSDTEDTPPTFNEDWWVATTGDDSNPCDSSGSPCLTVRQALTLAYARITDLYNEHPDLTAINTIIHVAAGTYNEPGMTSAMLRIAEPLSLVGAGSGVTILDGGGTLPGVLVTGGSAGETITISGLTIRNTSLGSAYACIDNQSAATLRLSDVTVENCIRYGIWNRGTGRLELNYSTVTSAVDEDTSPFILNGTGILNDSELLMVGTTVSNNADRGIINNGRLIARSGSVQDNQTEGISQPSTGEINLTDVDLSNNAVSGIGGAMLISGGTATITRGTISGHPNRAISLRGTLNMTGTTIDSNDAGALILYDGATATLDNVTITDNGSLDGYDVIFNYGNLTITNSHLNHNFKTVIYNTDTAVATISDTEFSDNRIAGANLPVIFNSDTSQLNMDHSLVAINRTGDRGAIENFGSGTMALSNVTVSGNRSEYAVRGNGNFDITYSTIADNEGYGLYAYTSTDALHIANVLVARNTSGDCPYPIPSYPSVVVEGTNIDTDSTCESFTTYTPSEVLLGPLADNGGPTQTHELLVSPAISPAIDAATGACPGDDQRGAARPAGASCDVGAYEASIAIAPIVSGDETPTPTTGLVTIITTTDTGCYKGPGEAWTRYSTLKAGIQAQVVGKGYGVDWLVVKHPEIANTNCWVNLKDVQFDFPLDTLRLIAIPEKPTPTPSPTNPPRENQPKPTVCVTDQQQQTICQ